MPTTPCAATATSSVPVPTTLDAWDVSVATAGVGELAAATHAMAGSDLDDAWLAAGMPAHRRRCDALNAAFATMIRAHPDADVAAFPRGNAEGGPAVKGGGAAAARGWDDVIGALHDCTTLLIRMPTAKDPFPDADLEAMRADAAMAVATDDPHRMGHVAGNAVHAAEDADDGRIPADHPFRIALDTPMLSRHADDLWHGAMERSLIMTHGDWFVLAAMAVEGRVAAADATPIVLAIAKRLSADRFDGHHAPLALTRALVRRGVDCTPVVDQMLDVLSDTHPSGRRADGKPWVADIRSAQLLEDLDTMGTIHAGLPTAIIDRIIAETAGSRDGLVMYPLPVARVVTILQRHRTSIGPADRERLLDIVAADQTRFGDETMRLLAIAGSDA